MTDFPFRLSKIHPQIWVWCFPDFRFAKNLNFSSHYQPLRDGRLNKSQNFDFENDGLRLIIVSFICFDGDFLRILPW